MEKIQKPKLETDFYQQFYQKIELLKFLKTILINCNCSHYNSQELRAAQQEFFAEKAFSSFILLIQQSMQEVQEAAIHAEKEAQEEPTKKLIRQ